MIARLVLVYPVMSMASQLGRWVQTVLRPEFTGTAYEGTLLGLLLGLVLGVSLWLGAIGAGGWRSDLASFALAILTVLWLLAAVTTIAGTISPHQALMAYGLALMGGAVALALVQ